MKTDKTTEEILDDKGILFSTFYSSSIYDAVKKAMQEYADQQLESYKAKLKDEIWTHKLLEYSRKQELVMIIENVKP